MLAEHYIPDCPPVPQADVEAAFTGMKDYIFVEKFDNNAKIFKCTACGETYPIVIPARTYTTEELELYKAKHREYCNCARCGKYLEVINTGRKKKLSDLKDTKAVAIVIPVSEDDVWIRCEFFYKHFANFPPTYTGESYEAYHFVKGEETEYYRSRYWYMDFIRLANVREPFGMSSSCCGFVWWDYSFIGLDRLEDTFFKYSLFREAGYANGENDDFLYLALYSQYPKVTEMLAKNGYGDLIRCKKNGVGIKKIIKFEATSFKELFKLTKDELNEWAKYKNNVETCKTYISLFRGNKNGFSLAYTWNRLINSYNTAEAKQVCKANGISYEDLIKYLKKGEKRFYEWRDYVEAAKDIGLDLTVHNVLFPKNLTSAHDEAVKIRKNKADEQARQKLKERCAALEKQYGYQGEEYMICIPQSTDEIIEEGKKLQHCVGGYAARHASGATTILFMRKVTEPDKPLYTIEMHGKVLRQVHGYKNRTSPLDVPDAKEFFNEWLDWVKSGSPKKKKRKAEAGVQASELGVAV